MSETINQDDHETIRATISIEPDDIDDSLPDAEEIVFFLTDRVAQGRGEIVMEKSLSDGEIAVIDGTTVEIELEPAETKDLAARTYYPEMTVLWDGNPSTTTLTPPIKVRETAYESTD